LDLDSFRELMVEVKKQGLTPSDLASHFRLNIYLLKSGAVEEELESFITNLISGYIPLGKAVEIVNPYFSFYLCSSVVNIIY
jgi:hypothetical protein